MRKTVFLCGTGSFIPQSNITERKGKVDCTSNLAAIAAKRALVDAGLQSEDIDLLILASVTPDRLVPPTSTTVQNILGANRAVAFDLNALNSSFLFGFITGIQFLKTGFFTNALIIGSDALSRITDAHQSQNLYLGDGAGAVVLQSSNTKSGIRTSYFKSLGNDRNDITIFGCGSELQSSEAVLQKKKHLLHLRPNQIVQQSVEGTLRSIDRVLARADLTLDDVKYICTDWINELYRRKLGNALGTKINKLTSGCAFNCFNGTLPITLDALNRQGKLLQGDHLLLTSASAGIAEGAVLITWTETVKTMQGGYA